MQTPKERFIEAYRQLIHRPGAESLLTWLCSTDFFEAPASTKYHGAFPGGLVIHSLNVFDRMSNNCVTEFGSDCSGRLPFPADQVESIAIVSLLHDICKAEFYKTEFKNKKVYSEHGTKRDNLGTFDWESVPFYTIEEKFPFGHGEKSVYLINEHMHLTRDEAHAIRYHMGDFSDQCTGRVFEMCPLAVQLHIADLQAAYLDESNAKLKLQRGENDNDAAAVS